MCKVFVSFHYQSPQHLLKIRFYLCWAIVCVCLSVSIRFEPHYSSYNSETLVYHSLCDYLKIKKNSFLKKCSCQVIPFSVNLLEESNNGEKTVGILINFGMLVFGSTNI